MGLARCHIPVHALDENVHYLVTGVSSMRQTAQDQPQVRPGLGPGIIYGLVDELNLVYIRTY
jgi:hypothetical protein